MTNYDRIDGRSVPGTVLTTDTTIGGIHNGSVHVKGCEVVVAGDLNGSFRISDSAVVSVLGTVNGSISVEANCQLNITGQCNGSTLIEQGATVLIEPTGRLAGALTNDGTLVIWGVFGGPYRGRGIRTIEGNGYIKQPVVRDGISYYEW